MAVQSSERVARFLLDALTPKLAHFPANRRVSDTPENTSPWESQFAIDLDGFGPYERFLVTVKAID